MTQSGLPDKAERCCCFCVGLSFASGLTDGSRPVSTNPQQSRKPRRYRHYRWGFLLLGDTMDTHQFTFATLLCAAQVQKSHRLPRDEMQAERPFYRISTICLKTLPNAPKFVTIVLMICPPWAKKQRMRPAFLPGQICRTYFYKEAFADEKTID